MAYYMVQISYPQDSIKAMAATPQHRSAKAEKLFGAMGGKLHRFFFAFGDHDAVIAGELPDNVTMAACSTAVSAAGFGRSAPNPRGPGRGVFNPRGPAPFVHCQFLRDSPLWVEVIKKQTI